MPYKDVKCHIDLICTTVLHSWTALLQAVIHHEQHLLLQGAEAAPGKALPLSKPFSVVPDSTSELL